jgi:hypothetical protein
MRGHVPILHEVKIKKAPRYDTPGLSYCVSIDYFLLRYATGGRNRYFSFSFEAFFSFFRDVIVSSSLLPS